MALTSEQSAAVSSWVAAGDNLSTIQKKLREQFSVAMTYMDVRFLVDDLNLQLVDAPTKVDTSDVSKTQPKAPAAKSAKAPAAAGKPTSAGTANADGTAATDATDDATGTDELPREDALPGEEDLANEALPGGGVILDVDSLTLNPNALASGKVTFSDGVTGKWIIDHQGRPGFTEISQPGYRPTPQDAQSFMTQLEAELQRKGL